MSAGETDPVVIVSGGSRGLGLGLVEAFLAQGWRVATFSKTRSAALEQLMRSETQAASLWWEAIDARDAAALASFVRATEKRWGGVDALVNNAAIASDGLLSVMRVEDVQRMLDVNLRSAVLLVRACARVMVRKGSGTIVNISSVNAIRGYAGVSVYSATKAALDGLTRSLARELGPRRIRVNSVAPGYFESEMSAELDSRALERIARRTPLGRLAKISEIVDAVLFLVGPRASFITGQVLVVDGGLTC